VTDLVLTFNFVVRLTRTAVPVTTLRPPPDLGSRAAPTRQTTQAAANPGRRRAPQVTAGNRPAPGADAQVLGDGGFCECGGLELEAEIRDYPEGGRNDGVVRGAGRAKLVPIVLKRGMLVGAGDRGTALWDWLQGMVEGRLPIARYDGSVEVLGPAEGPPDSDRTVVARWTFDSGLPSKVSGPVLNAKTGEVGIEELHILHEGLRLERRPS
jgi:phage tail-like protein